MFIRKKQNHYLKPVLTIIISLMVLLLFSFSFESLSKNTKEKQLDSLKNALNRDITYCYAMEGRYPESLEYLKRNYGLVYNEEAFYVDYKIEAVNLYPSVTVIERNAQK